MKHSCFGDRKVKEFLMLHSRTFTEEQQRWYKVLKAFHIQKTYILNDTKFDILYRYGEKFSVRFYWGQIQLTQELWKAVMGNDLYDHQNNRWVELRSFCDQFSDKLVLQSTDQQMDSNCTLIQEINESNVPLEKWHHETRDRNTYIMTKVFKHHFYIRHLLMSLLSKEYTSFVH